jgi:hypothetical protein
VVVGAVLIPGAKAPRLVTRDMLGTMKKGSVLVDVAIDQGGCFETSKATTHGNPTYVVDGVVHYCVANMPGAVAKTSTLALTNATLPYAVQIANKGWKKAMQENAEIKAGANVIDGKVTYKAVAEAFDMDFTPVEQIAYPFQNSKFLFSLQVETQEALSPWRNGLFLFSGRAMAAHGVLAGAFIDRRGGRRSYFEFTDLPECTTITAYSPPQNYKNGISTVPHSRHNLS